MISRPLLVVVAAMLVVACAHKKVPPPPEQLVKVGTQKAVYRDWSKVNICAVDRQRFGSDLDSMNELLAQFVANTSGGTEDAWTDEQIAMLEEGKNTLPAPIDGHEAALKSMARCRFNAKTGFPDRAKKGAGLIQQARSRLAEAPTLLVTVNGKRALERWKQAQPTAQQSAREQWCPPKPKPNSVNVFYAFEDEAGKTQWLFCDGAKVQSSSGSKPEFIAPEGGKKPGKKPQPKPYLDAAARYPASELQHAPKMPEATNAQTEGS